LPDAIGFSADSDLRGDPYDKSRLPRDQFPTLGKILVDQIGLAAPVAELESLIEKAYCEKLY
jgi:hypothetical protein